jgi:hypothetical protein
VRNVVYGAGLLMMLLSLATPVAAGIPTAVPEINGGSLITGLGLLSGSVLILRARLGSKRK